MMAKAGQTGNEHNPSKGQDLESSSPLGSLFIGPHQGQRPIKGCINRPKTRPHPTWHRTNIKIPLATREPSRQALRASIRVATPAHPPEDKRRQCVGGGVQNRLRSSNCAYIGRSPSKFAYTSRLDGSAARS